MIMEDNEELICLVAGTFPLDNLMVRHGRGNVECVNQHVGGTAGNVASILAWYGWHSLPAARLDDSETGFQIKADLESYGCDTRYVTNDAKGGTTIYDITHRTDAEGNHKMSLRAHTPTGGPFVNHRFWTRQQARDLFDSLEQLPDVFFFDHCAPGNILLANMLHERGVLVYYEPNEPVSRNFMRAVEASDIVKFSNQRHPDVSFAEGFTNKLFVQTMNEEGLRFRLRGGEWQTLPPVVNTNVVDGEGAGDWTTSAFINELGRRHLLGFEEVEAADIRGCLEAAQRVASESVSYLGAKGLIHH